MAHINTRSRRSALVHNMNNAGWINRIDNKLDKPHDPSVAREYRAECEAIDKMPKYRPLRSRLYS